eukprot:CAMPEP_0115362424 /NCGR_PEP_ID=MMETSP0270-20121206/102698_1 /TAXON_ID=71861 /ORGANISM="Scrippsiella trochoidea, Strain CCMP3099" /LENGTH=35 /DNA_ID= /DNA_START= /DNA_END= /DNA_ORIENTATION=
MGPNVACEVRLTTVSCVSLSVTAATDPAPAAVMLP